MTEIIFLVAAKNVSDVETMLFGSRRCNLIIRRQFFAWYGVLMFAGLILGQAPGHVEAEGATA
jgi:hypothetical protein